MIRLRGHYQVSVISIVSIVTTKALSFFGPGVIKAQTKKNIFHYLNPPTFLPDF